MKLEDQVVSVELAKEMKELGVGQDSLWYHAKFEDESYLDVVGASPPDPIFQLIQRGYFDFAQFDEIYSAYTVAELGEMLPGRIKTSDSGWCYLYITKPENTKEWLVAYYLNETKESTEADARAKMLIYLIKAGIIKVGEVGK